jgi:nucleoside transporter
MSDASTASAPTSNAKPQTFKLWLMMVLQFFIWGAWLPLVFGYLAGNVVYTDSAGETVAIASVDETGAQPVHKETNEVLNEKRSGLHFTAGQQTWILIAFPVAAIIAMFFSNQFADRNFAAEKFLAFSHLIGGLAILGLYFVTDFWTFCILMWVHCLFYVPTISITNAIAFNAMKDAQKEFGIVRMGGTIGWILAAWPLFFLLTDAEAAKYTYLIAGAASIILAGYSFSLPHTPPNKSAEGLAWLRALKSLAIPFVLVLWLVTMVDAMVHDLYFMWTSGYLEHIGIPTKYVMPIMSIGQVAEIGTMVVLGFFLKRLGWKTTMTIGILGHAIRFGIFAFVPIPAVVIAANVLHGVCYAFFFATVYIFVDEYLPKDVRSSTQGLFNLMILGMGPIVARIVAPYLAERYLPDGGIKDYQGLFTIPCVIAVVAAVVLMVAFWPPKNDRGDVKVSH